MRKLAFDPAQHGFHFTNLFINNVAPGITTYGLCGGMALAAARYFQYGLAIPTHVPADFPDGSPAGVPPVGSALHAYIYDCQMQSYGPLGIASAANWVTMPWVTLDNQFDWSVAEFEAVRARIDAGAPVVLGLRRVEGGPMGHQVLAYGYDERDKRIFVYDSNYHDEEKTLRLDIRTRTIVYDGASSPQWSSYFITGCEMTGPRPPYADLAVTAGISLSNEGPLPVGSPLTARVTVTNVGQRDAHVSNLYLYVRGPGGENLDTLLGGSDGDASPIAPGRSRTLERTARAFGGTPGTYTIGVSYLSRQDRWVSVPALLGGTRNEVRLQLTPTQPPQRPWHSLGGVLTSTPAVTANADERLEVIARGTDNRMWHRSQRRPGTEEFGDWEVLPGDQQFAGAPAVVLNHWSKLELFARGRDGGLWHRWQNDPSASSAAQWSPWTPKGGSLASDPTVTRNADDRLEVFAIHADGRMYHLYQRWFDPFGAPWSGWEGLGTRAFRGTPAAGRDAGGCLWLFALGHDDDTLWRCHQTAPGGGWTDWEDTGARCDAFTVNGYGRGLSVLVRGRDGRPWRSTLGAGGFSPWQIVAAGSHAVTLGVGTAPTLVNHTLFSVEGDGEAYCLNGSWTAVGSGLASPVFGNNGDAHEPTGAQLLFALGRSRDLLVHTLA